MTKLTSTFANVCATRNLYICLADALFYDALFQKVKEWQTAGKSIRYINFGMQPHVRLTFGYNTIEKLVKEKRYDEALLLAQDNAAEAKKELYLCLLNTEDLPTICKFVESNLQYFPQELRDLVQEWTLIASRVPPTNRGFLTSTERSPDDIKREIDTLRHPIATRIQHWITDFLLTVSSEFDQIREKSTPLINQLTLGLELKHWSNLNKAGTHIAVCGSHKSTARTSRNTLRGRSSGKRQQTRSNPRKRLR